MYKSFKLLNSLFITSLLFTSFTIFAKEQISFDDQRPENINDQKWSDLKTAVQEAKLLPTPMGLGGSNSNYGYSVSINGDRALVGAPNVAGKGAVYVLDYNGSTWIESTVLIPIDLEKNIFFGVSVSLFGDRALIGSAYDNTNGDDSGSAYVFDFDGSIWSQTQKLFAGDGQALDYFGTSVSLSGNRALIGSNGDDDNGDNSGSAYVFDFDGNLWSQSQKLTATDAAVGDNFGASVSMSGDRVLIGASLNDDVISDSGTAYIFDINAGVWSQSQKLSAADGAENDRFGVSVSLSNNRALIGAFGDDENGDNSGSAYVFDFDGSNWSQSQKLIADDGGTFNHFGFSVSLSTDRILIGARFDDDNGTSSGSAYVYDFDGNLWQQSQKLIADDGANHDFFGSAVSLSGDQVFIGAYQDDDTGNNSGSVYVFTYASSLWTQNQKFNVDGATDDWFGSSVSLWGNRALIGALFDDDLTNGTNSGSVYIFDFNGSAWSLSQKITPTDGASIDSFGASVSLWGDRALIGASGDDDLGFSSGSVYVFDYDGSSWSQSQKIIADDGAENDVFGSSVSLSSDRVLIGARGDDDNGDASGSAYIFDFNGNLWSQSHKLTATDGASNDNFGFSVSLFGNRALVGAEGNDINNSSTGAAYVFDLDNGVWSQNQKLFANDGASNDRFGVSVSLSNDRALIGASGDDDNGNNSGSAYVFDFDSNLWSQTQKLTAIDASSSANFGVSVNLAGDRILIGATGDSDNGPGSGAAYEFRINGNLWTQVQKLIAVDGATGDTFGIAVSLSGDKALVGALFDNDNGLLSGSAYVFDITPKYSVSVNVSGLAVGNSFELLNNGTDNLTIFTDGVAIISSELINGTGYNVIVNPPQPTSPNQNCVVLIPKGVINSADVVLDIICTTIQYNIGVNVTGLAATNSVSFANGADTLIVNTNGSNTLSTLDDGSSYAVSITAQPDTPNQTCSITSGNGSANIAGSDVTITVNCSTTQYNVDIAVTGLAATNSVSFANGADTLIFNADGTNTISTLADGSSYAVSITAQPDTPNQTCSITSGNGSANIAGSDVTITVNCSTTQYNVDIAVTGLAATNSVSFANGADTLIVNTDGTNRISTLADGSSYNVTITEQPTTPSQFCSITSGNASANLAGSNIIISVNCSTNSYSVGGTISGLIEGNSVTLQNNGADNLMVSTNGGFTFNTALADKSPYLVSVLSQSSGQVCSVSNASGMLAGANVSDVLVTCVTQSITIDIGSIDFGQLFVGENQSSTITVLNNGAVATTITGLNLLSAPFTVAGGSCIPTPVTLMTGQSCTIQVSFNPTFAGDFNRTLQILSTAPSSPHSVFLSGSSSVRVIPTLSYWSLILMMLLFFVVAMYSNKIKHMT